MGIKYIEKEGGAHACVVVIKPISSSNVYIEIHILVLYHAYTHIHTYVRRFFLLELENKIFDMLFSISLSLCFDVYVSSFIIIMLLLIITIILRYVRIQNHNFVFEKI